MVSFNFLFRNKANQASPHGARVFDGAHRAHQTRPVPAQAAAPAAQEPADAAHVAPRTQIAYDPDLVQRLKADHQQLLELFGKISAAFANNELPLTAELLDDFRHQIQAHLLTENIRFYIYLEHSLTSDMASAALVHNFRQEMDDIGKAVLAFLVKYKEIATRPDFSVPFGKDLEQIGKVLADRVKREEDTLYPLYFPVY